MPDEPIESEEELERRLRKLLGEAESADAEELDEIELKLREVEDKLSVAEEGRRADDTLFDKEFEDRLQKLHDKADSAKQAQNATKAERFRQQASDQASSRGAGVGLSIAYTIIGLPLAGAGIGWLLNRATGGNAWVGIGTILGATLGVIMAVVMVNRMKV